MPRNMLPDLSEFPDCSGLTDNGRCIRLNVVNCQGENCSFKRTKKEDINSIKRAYQLLSSLDRLEQIHIAKKYFNGYVPWIQKTV